MKQKFIKTGLIVLLIVTFLMRTVLIYADASELIDSIRYQASIVAEQQAQTVYELNTLYENINYLEEQKGLLLSQADQYDQQIITTIATIDTIVQEIEKKENELNKTGEQLNTAKEQKKVQQEAMKKRIQYMYEEGKDNGLLQSIIEVKSVAEVLNRVENTQDIYKFDRECLNSYTETVEKIEGLQKLQQKQRSELVAAKKEQEQIQKELERLKGQVLAASSDYQAQISYCTEVAAQYEALIQQQNDQIWQLQVMQAEAIAEEQARIYAAQQAAIQAAAAQQVMEQAYVQNQGQVEVENVDQYYYDGNEYENNFEQTYVPVESQEMIQEVQEVGYEEPAPTYSDGSLGSQIANYATQFVGNPYVWGGTSLTNGADCSGFVQSVFGDYGINLSRTTYTQANEGTAVSYSDMQPGDVINYGFHTAIYLGDNKIVHAADQSQGIIIQDNPAYQPIVTIRRFTE